MKYYLDEGISPKVAGILKKQQIDVVSTHDVNMTQATDKAQLEYAASVGRALVTRNRNDYIRLTVQFFNDLRPHFGVLIVPYSIPGDNFRILADALNKYASLHTSGMEPYTIDFIRK